MYGGERPSKAPESPTVYELRVACSLKILLQFLTAEELKAFAAG